MGIVLKSGESSADAGGNGYKRRRRRAGDKSGEIARKRFNIKKSSKHESLRTIRRWLRKSG